MGQLRTSYTPVGPGDAVRGHRRASVGGPVQVDPALESAWFQVISYQK
jgi:hypothetical protein